MVRKSQSTTNIQILLADLKACSRTRNLGRGKQVHAEASELRHDSSIYVANALINMYAKCGSMLDARQVFNDLKYPSVVSWTTLILGYADNGDGRTALDLFTKMNTEGPHPDSVTFVAALKACTSLAVKEGAGRWAERGKELHRLAADNGCNLDVYVQSSLVDMYAKCGNMVDSRRVFERMEHPDVVSWTALILGYAQNGQGRTALDLFTRMKTEGSAPNTVTFVAAFKACTSIAVNEGASRWAECRERGREIHKLAVKTGCSSDVYVQSTLVDMYAKCGSMEDARQVFDRMKHPDIVSWNVLILGYTDNGQSHTALNLFAKMTADGPAPDSVTFVAALKSCTFLAMKEGASQWLARGKEIHKLSAEFGCNSDVYVQSTVVDMYAKCGNMVESRQVFDRMKHPDVVSWTALILGYANNGQGHIALDLFTKMKTEGFPLNPLTFMAALKCCTSLAVTGRRVECLERGKEIHRFAIEKGCSSDLYVQNTLLNMYAKCGSMIDARQVFDSFKNATVVTWTTLIMGYVDNGQADIALDLFTRMKLEGPVPDPVTFVAALKACTSLAAKGGASQWVGCRDRGKEIHNLASKYGCSSDAYVQSTLVDMYAKCGSLSDAREAFDSMKHPDVVSWNVLILGYADNGQGHTALDLFTRMRILGPAPDSVTFGAVLKACGLVGALEFGRKIHSEMDQCMNLDVVLVTCLVDFYAKCGSLTEAQTVFDFHSESRDMITWTALLAGFSSCGDSQAVFRLFEAMQDSGFRPDGVTFLCLLTCCSHVGLVEKGKECFDAMPIKYGIIPGVEHYTCMVDIFGRANKLDEAMTLLDLMPCKPNDVTWLTVLGACQKWKNVEIGRLAFKSLIKLNERDAAGYVLMGQIYESRGMLQEREMVVGCSKKLRTCKKQEESCWTNEVGDVHTFSAENATHPQIQEIQHKWKSMGLDNSTSVGREEAELCGHSERLALVCALINTKPGKTVRIVKNLGVCDNCHSAIAHISNLESRTIICRDVSRIHVFKDGKCSCGDNFVAILKP